MSKYINDWKPEVKSLLETLVKHGIKLVGGDNGEEAFNFHGDMDKFIKNLIACDEALLYVKTPKDARTRSLYLVLGNSPGELVSDYTVDETIEKAATEHAEAWEGKKQPKMLSPYA